MSWDSVSAERITPGCVKTIRTTPAGEPPDSSSNFAEEDARRLELRTIRYTATNIRARTEDGYHAPAGRRLRVPMTDRCRGAAIGSPSAQVDVARSADTVKARARSVSRNGMQKISNGISEGHGMDRRRSADHGPRVRLKDHQARGPASDSRSRDAAGRASDQKSAEQNNETISASTSAER